ncbi:hypothetical protein EC174750_0225 [Escherichia coli 174750]|nr:hypothetical protein EC174750_0225 [Escherichia coli 174750]
MEGSHYHQKSFRKPVGAGYKFTRQRMQNRARLLKQYQTHLKKQASYIVEGNAESRRALRQHNRDR